MAGIKWEQTQYAVKYGVDVGVGVGTGKEDGVDDDIGMELTKDQSIDRPTELTEPKEFGHALPVNQPSGDLPSNKVSMATHANVDNAATDKWNANQNYNYKDDNHTNLFFGSLPLGWIKGRDLIS
mmetsp:Transcript_30710/g.64099  ORF Transcript_30710/g.64099 Transcript_30710/m.64099 type:complete len:125 (-) Transcript_30710:438-812(-)